MPPLSDWQRDATNRERGVGDFETLLQACVELGARFIVCEMGLRSLGIALEDHDLRFDEDNFTFNRKRLREFCHLLIERKIKIAWNCDSRADLSDAETVRTGCDLRFRPLLMTALTSFIGHLPMLYATGSGADIQKPLAVVVMVLVLWLSATIESRLLTGSRGNVSVRKMAANAIRAVLLLVGLLLVQRLLLHGTVLHALIRRLAHGPVLLLTAQQVAVRLVAGGGNCAAEVACHYARLPKRLAIWGLTCWLRRESSRPVP